MFSSSSTGPFLTRLVEMGIGRKSVSAKSQSLPGPSLKGRERGREQGAEDSGDVPCIQRGSSSHIDSPGMNHTGHSLIYVQKKDLALAKPPLIVS